LRLLRRGRRREAARAATLHHVIAPEPGGALTALAAAEDADVILVAHGGLSGLGVGGGGLFRRAPIDQVFRVHLWYIGRGEIPSSDQGRQRWLLDCWQRIDEWVAADEAS
ncbi:MAG: 1-acyl-sn-glycerol-3-phosphate acyltransferase, partial [Candidatus Dormibacteraeota bacterium]|nr:1-acyl-sn-glycerol-3-phosphate acyltransferase [Candidatus Dormibacteraeota bacterium]